jgi:hypothetical protein
LIINKFKKKDSSKKKQYAKNMKFHIIGITGHQNIQSEHYPDIERLVRVFYAEIKKQHSFAQVTVLSSLAKGADMLCAQIALDMGFRLVVPLPMDVEEYRKDFSGKTDEEFASLLSRADEVFVVSPEKSVPQNPVRGFFYRQAGIYITKRCDILLALWDGIKKETLDGAGTYATIKLAKELGKEVKWIQTK